MKWKLSVYGGLLFLDQHLVININHRARKDARKKFAFRSRAERGREEKSSGNCIKSGGVSSEVAMFQEEGKKSTSVSPKVSRGNLNNSATDTNLARGLFACDGGELRLLMLGNLAMHKAARSLSGSAPRVLD